MAITTAMLNGDEMMRRLQSQLNKEMMEAAEPVIRKAVAEAEREIRKRLGVVFVGLLESQFSVERCGTDLRILVKHVVEER